MGEVVIAAVGLGVAGLDPAGALIAAAALAAGARRRSVLVFGVIVVVGTVLLGTALSLGVGTELAGVDWLALLPAGRLGAALELAVGVALLAWGIIRLARRRIQPPKPRRARAGTAGLALTGLVFALGAVLDPTFVAVTVLAARSPTPVGVVAVQLLWILISQAPLVFVAVATALGRHQPAVERFTRWWDRARPALRTIATIALLLIGATLTLDAVWWFVTGQFLLPSP